MIRPTTPGDTPHLVRLTAETGFFKPLEIEALQEVLDDYHAANRGHGHRSVTSEAADGAAVGYAYFAPAAMTDRTWYLYWLAVEKGRQGGGLGGDLLRRAEADVRDAGGRLLVIETSSLPLYGPTRRFYLKHGYAAVAEVPDFYADGDGMAVFTKRIRG